jgi:hypothetical protein
MLDRSMMEHLHVNETGVVSLEKDFTDRLKLAVDLFGNRAFRFQDDEGRWQLSVPLYDGIMVAVDRLWESRKQLLSSKAEVAQKVVSVLKNEAAFEVIVGRPNTANAVQRRMDVLTKAIESAV